MTEIPCYIFDIDGTLADGSHRIHLITNIAEGAKKDWRGYFALCSKDQPIPHMVQLCRTLMEHGTVLFVSGRTYETWEDTLAWLKEHVHWTIEGWHLFMRGEGDYRNDDIVKIEILAQLRAQGFNPVMAFDDRNRVVKAWRAAGIPCAQVAEGDF